MKKLVTLLLAAALTLGGAASASAVDVKVSGRYDFLYEFYGNLGTTSMNGAFLATEDSGNPNKHHGAVQRMIIGAEFRVSENLSAYYDAIFGYFTWGGPALTGAYYPPQQSGGGLGTRAANIITRQAYLDWTIPNTSVKIRMGQQPWGAPAFACGNPALPSDFGTGITVTAPINDMASVTAAWLRVAADPIRGTDPFAGVADHTDGTFDYFSLVVPLRFDGFRVAPWAAVGVVGKNTLTYGPAATAFPDADGAAKYRTWGNGAMAPKKGTTIAADLDNSIAWWVGMGGEMTLFDPFRLGFDALYGDNGQDGSWSRSGWVASMAASYTTDWGVPTLKAWYASGDDDDTANGSERAPGPNGSSNPGANIMFGRGTFGLERNTESGRNLFGTWGVSAQWNNLSFIENLSHNLSVTYVAGTNDKAMATKIADFSTANMLGYLTEKDSLIEVDFETVYNIYKNLAAALQISYIFQDFDEKLWLPEGKEFSNAYRIGLGLRYTF